MIVTLCIYALQWHVKWRIMLYCSVRKGLHWHNPYLNISFIYTCTGAHNPYSHSCTGYTGRNYMYLGVGIMICSYLGLGMRYESESWTIVISMNRVFKWCQFCCGLNFDPKLWKTMDWVRFLAKMWPSSIITFKTLFESSFDADHNGRTPSFISQSHSEIQFVFLWTMIWCLQYCEQQERSFIILFIFHSSAPEHI